MRRPPGKRGIPRLLRAFVCSCRGLAAAWRDEEAFRIEVVTAVVAVPAGLWLGADGAERGLLAGSALLVLVVELVNSAIEAVVDRIGLDHHPLSGQAKDVASAAVLVSLLLAGVVWLAVLGSRWRG